MRLRGAGIRKGDKSHFTVFTVRGKKGDKRMEVGVGVLGWKYKSGSIRAMLTCH